jgi:hypothetical protein
MRLAFLCMVFIAPLTLAGEKVAGLVWDYGFVGTPEFLGPPKLKEPVPLNGMPSSPPCPVDQLEGTFEAIVQTDGTIAKIHWLEPIDLTECQRRLVNPLIGRWRFKPATFEGVPTPAIMRVNVYGE